MFESRGNCPFSKTGLLTSKFSIVKFLLDFFYAGFVIFWKACIKIQFTGLLLNFLKCVEKKIAICLFSIQGFRSVE